MKCLWELSLMKMDISLIAAQNVYDILLQRYKELRRGSSSSENDDEAYDINPYLMSLSTEKIDADYMDSRFKKYVKMLNEHADERAIESVLNELHRSFASLTQDEQKYANILLKDIQNNDFIVREDSNVMDYIVEYQTRAKSDQISTFARQIGISEWKLRDIMNKHVTERDINAFGQYDELIMSVDIDIAKKYFDKVEGDDIPRRKVRAKLDELVRRFILEGGLDISDVPHL